MEDSENVEIQSIYSLKKIYERENQDDGKESGGMGKHFEQARIILKILL